MPAIDKCLNIDDIRRVAHRRLPRPVAAFLEGGAEDETTMARNRAAFSQWALLPRAMQDVGMVNPATRLLGQEVAWPFIVGPTGMPGLIDIAGYAAVARAAGETGALYVLSTMASQSIEDVAAAHRGPKAFQLYLFRDRGITRELIQRAREAGYGALILTIDVQVPANRERDKRSGMTVPPRFGLGSLVDFALHPRWCWDQIVRKPVALANFTGARAAPGMSLLSYINEQFDPRITWDDLAWVAAEWAGPLAVKGIMRPDDAVLAQKAGAGAVILSNHGGRQLDGGASPMDVLAETAERLGGAADIIVDGGIRRGTDILKAIALGAAGAMSGRVGLYGLAAGGEAGARQAMRLLRSEFDRNLALLGTPTLAQVGRDCIVPLACPACPRALTSHR